MQSVFYATSRNTWTGGGADTGFECLKEKLRDYPNFTAPVTTFISSFKKLKTDSSLQSALATSSKGPVIKGQYRRRKGYLQTTTPAVARRKVALDGRRALIPGRPTKASAREHPYHKTGRKRSALHCLAHYVDLNMSLGGTHLSILSKMTHLLL